MDKQELRKIAVSMGYRPMNINTHPNLYAKPWAYTILVIDTEEESVAQWFRDGTGKFALWKRCPIENIYSIKDYEAYSIIERPGSSDANFEFINLSEWIATL